MLGNGFVRRQTHERRLKRSKLGVRLATAHAQSGLCANNRCPNQSRTNATLPRLGERVMLGMQTPYLAIHPHMMSVQDVDGLRVDG